MLEKIGKLENLKSIEKYKVDLNKLSEGTNLFENFIIFKNKKRFKIYNRICDHAGGKIISKNGETICPVHQWKFNPGTGFYQNGIKKKELNFSINNNIIEIEILKLKPKIVNFSNKNHNTKIRFFNHAFLKFFGKDFSFSVDPWAIGPAFNTGWWLKYATKNDWLENLNNSDFIFISHNHPDHLHPLTLSKINKNIPIFVPNFLTDSTGKYIEDLGFKKIFRLEFNEQYNLKGTDLVISVLKSGDFREDSGIYFSNGSFEGLLSVDAQMLNFERFPNVNFYGGSFAGGATGYPLMFENYKPKERVKISLKDKNFLRMKKLQDLKKIKPNYFMPYAGFFEEKLNRDSKIKKNNQKNSIEDYLSFCKKNKIELLNVLKNDYFEFNGKVIQKASNLKKEFTKDLKKEDYLNYFKSQYNKIDLAYIKEYFLNSKFKDNLHLYILLSDDNFKSLGENYLIKFENLEIKFKKISNFKRSSKQNDKGNRKLILKVRKESFLNTIYNKLPWEDLLVGFQCKVLRSPNVYNYNFWHHFTNVYTTSKNVRSITKCGACTKLTQFFDNNIYNSKDKILKNQKFI